MSIKDDNDVLVPGLTQVQIDALDKLFPERSADLKWTDREVWFKGGERSVVRFLKEQFKRQYEG